MILAIRTDTVSASVVLLSEAGDEVDRRDWEAGRKLSQELLPTISDVLSKQKLVWHDVRGLVVWEGPGSFTGLRIGITVANTIAYSLGCPIAGTTGDKWIEQGVRALKEKRAGEVVVPRYGAEANITRPKR
jgi:tRNA threonylcarbamoyladenosine biosynthesis protein TsaB